MRTCGSPIRCSASAVAARQTSAFRRSLHKEPATVVPTAEERARHLALATTEPDGEIAAILGMRHGPPARGAPATAAGLAEERAGSHRRLTSGRATTSSWLPQVTTSRATPERANVLLVGAKAEGRARCRARLGPRPFAAVQADPHLAALHHEALAESEGDDALEATTHLRLAALMQWGDGVERGLAHSEQAATAATRTDDVALRCCALAVYGDWQLRAGRGIAHAEMDEAVTPRERTLPDAPLREGPTWVYCHQLVWSVELDAATDDRS